MTADPIFNQLKLPCTSALPLQPDTADLVPTFIHRGPKGRARQAPALVHQKQLPFRQPQQDIPRGLNFSSQLVSCWTSKSHPFLLLLAWSARVLSSHNYQKAKKADNELPSSQMFSTWINASSGNEEWVTC